MILTAEQKENMKKKRLLLYGAKIFELEMDQAAAVAVGDVDASEEIKGNINKLRQACAAVEQL